MVNILYSYSLFAERFMWGIVGLFVAAGFAIMTIAMIKDFNIPRRVKIGFAIVTLSIFLISVPNILSQPKITYYEITITDNMNFKEFDTKYEVVKQRGEIYTVILKENNNED